MASLDRADPIIMGHILAQHRELHDQLVTARAALAVPSPAGRANVTAARAVLRGLSDYLHRHFAQEERGGFLEESLARMPRLSPAVKALLAEHPVLLGELDRLIETVAAADRSPAAWHQAGRDFACFADHLTAHERNENAVVQDGYNEDMGLD
ncbi:hemerythrin domain-containing protein [bacterium]|nr:hemerythrin domain-containing protein [bacterium]